MVSFTIYENIMMIDLDVECGLYENRNCDD